MKTTIEQFLSELANLDIKLWVEGEANLRCNAPKGALTPDIRTQLNERKTEIINFLQQINLNSDPAFEPISLVRRDSGNFPLSSSQTRLWFLDRLEGQSSTYNVPAAVQITGELQVDAFEQAIAEIVRRHEVLHTHFEQVNGNAVQVIDADFTLTLPIIDLQELAADKQSAEVQRLAVLEATKPFDLSKSPLMRVTLLRLGAKSHVFLLNMHHVVSDAWSIGIFIQELSTLYVAFSSGKISPLPELSIQYADFAAWQRQWLSGEVYQAKLNYWKQQLADAPPLLELPTDKPRPPIQTFKGSSLSYAIAPNLSEKLKLLSQKSGVTLFMTLHAAFALLIHRYSGQNDVSIGTPIANRNRKEIEPLIGFFVNTLVLRTRLEENQSFSKLLKQVQQVTLKAYEHQDVPFERVVEALQTERNLSHSPLFQVMFALQNAPMGQLELPGVTIAPLEIETVTSKFDLTLSMEETPQGLIGTWEYSTDLFNADTITRMAGHFQNLLEAIVASSEAPLNSLSFLTDAEKHQLLVEWNSNQGEYPVSQCIHEVFEEQVQKTPDAVAVVYADQHLTYAELNARANKVAHYLQSLGVGADMLVGICLERSLEMIIGILGILKAGGAYVPLDPDYPSDRLAYMLDDSQASVLLTQQKLTNSLPHSTARVICLDTDWEVINQLSQENLNGGAAPNNLAYVIYTSGSTGKPKGVLVNHQNVVRLFAATDSWFNFNETDVWTLFHSIAFDFSVWEIWGALLYGGSLIVVPYLVSRSPEAFYNLLIEKQVTVLNQTPSAFRQLIRVDALAGTNKQLSLRWVVFGGEALEPQSLKPWFERHPEHLPQLVNMYGITETTVHVTYRPLTIADINEGDSVIGCPIPDLQMYILDENLQPVPIGVRGEMYVGGAGLARGYLNRPELTTERFINNPFSDLQLKNWGENSFFSGTSVPEERLYEKSKNPKSKIQNPKSIRLYKTGDLARYRSDGNVEYLGRIDHQVKIRGFRIELGEIEAVLATYPEVREAIVIDREDQPGNKRLVAYIVSNVEQPTSSELRKFLQQKLPNYMVPSAFIFLDALPLTSNGKVDRRLLPAPDQARPELEARFVAPRTREEELLANIWAEVLNLEEVGIYDNFFELGGDSIRSIQVLAKAKEIGLDFSLQQLFQYQTIGDLIGLVGNEQGLSLALKTEAFSLISEEERLHLPEDVDDAYPMAALQKGMIFHSEYSSDTAIYHDIFTYNIRGPLDIQILQTAVQQLVSRHAVLRTSFAMTGFKEPLQLVHQTVDVPLQLFDISHLSTAEQEAIIDEWIASEKKRPFDWNVPPLLRFQVHRRTEETFNLALSFHHAILDGWSVASFITELLQQYLLLLGKEVPALPEAPAIAFRDFVALEQTAIQSPESQQYWTEKLNDITITNLPRWPESYLQRGTELGVQEVSISAEVSEKLKQLATKIGVPLKSILLAAHLRVLKLLGNQADILTGLVSNGRLENADGTRVLGLFLNTLPFRLNLAGGTWTELVQQTFEAEREALPYRRYPLAEVQRILGGQPLFETAFNFVHFHVYQGIAALPGLEVLGAKFFEQTNLTLIANFSLDLFSSQVKLLLTYDAGELCEEQLRDIGGYYVRTLEALVAQPSGRYEEKSLLSDSEQQKLLLEWNGTQADYVQENCIHQLFEEQVERTPDAVAVVFEDNVLTYAELNDRANQLAHYLQSLGVKPEVLVGICLERSLEMVIGLLGILKAGGAYVPLDPDYPSDRLSYMLNDSQVSVLLTQQKLLNSLPPEHTTQIICLDTDWGAIAAQSQENLVSGTSQNNLAYVIYTSGSTGKPKGVLVSHQNVTRLFAATQSWFHFHETDVWALFHSIAFDFSVWELWGALFYGGRLVIVPYWVSRDPEAFYTLLLDERVTVVNQTPSAFRQLIRVDELKATVESQLSLRLVIFGGEALEPASLKPWFERHGDRFPELVNMYGITETTVHVTYRPLTIADINLRSSVIGTPIPDLQVYILNEHLQPVPIGVSGEMHVGGAGLARGYLKRPELTQEKFISNPFSDLGLGDSFSGREVPPERLYQESNNPKSSRLYKSGDLARYLPDGNIEFLGRIDNQVKIRGFRIELGEIEAALTAHPKVRQAVVIAPVEEQTGSKRLVAYIVSKVEPLTTNELRDFLKQKLPGYMVPSAFVLLDAMPLTSNGKVDRRALPLPDIALSRSVSFVPPRTPTEEAIAGIFTEILKVEQVGIHDSFFELGGHSLNATQVISRLRETFSIELPLRCLFESPTVAQLDRSIWTSRQTASELIAPAIEPAPRDTLELPLSWAQARLWFLDQLLEDETASYNIPAAVQIIGNLNVDVLNRAIAEIVQRHEILRTYFQQVNGTPVQVIDPSATVSIPVVDLQKLPENEQSTVVQQLVTEEAKLPFDLSVGIGLRVKLLRLGSQSHVLLVTMHHIICDGWSIGIFIQEFSTLYQAFLLGEPNPLPPLPIQYTDFAVWQRQWLSGEVLEAKLHYWKQQLADAPSLLKLPTDRARPPVQTFQGSSIARAIDTDLTQKLKKLSQKAGVTLFMTLQAAFATLLSRYSGQDDVSIGTPIANRNRKEIEPLIGFFVNTLVLRTRIEGNPSFVELLKQVQQVALDAYAHQDVPFEQVVEALQLERNLSHTPLFQVMFVLQNAPMGKLELPEMSLTPVQIESLTAKFDLTLAMEETPEGLIGTWEYNSDLFDADTIARMALHFQNLLEAVVAFPSQPVGSLPLLTDSERHKLLVEWNNTQTDYPACKCIHQLFEEQVQRTPDAVAVVYSEQQLTYSQLNSRANQIAHYLQALGVGADVLVGICVERSLEMIVGLLGILKAGGAYVPLDPHYPGERLSYMLSDSQVSVLLTQQHLLEMLPSSEAKVICLDSENEVIAKYSQQNPATEVKADNLAYVMYTSGSTGLPKGVSVIHRGVVRLVKETNYVSLSAAEVFLQLASISFDASTFEIWGSLLNGAKLVVIPIQKPSLEELGCAIRKYQVTTLWLTASLFRLMVDERLEDLKPVRQLLAGGDALSVTHVQKLLLEIGQCKLINGYGPTENTTFTCCFPMTGQTKIGSTVPLGRPIANTQVYILDRHLQPVPIGVTGELYVGGAGLARGYFNRPELTQEKFIPNPFSNEPFSRLYKTGDLARYLPDGNIEFLGRIDNQVKIRGFRIEIAEIESVLALHHEVLEAVVIVQEDQPGNKCLVAYIVPGSNPPTTSELHRFLKQKLPDYMIPSAFVMLDALPLTDNSKVNRRALPIPGASIPQLSQTFGASLTPAEELLTEIWTEVLGVENIGIYDNFFDLGGHSLLAAQLISRIRQAFELELPVRYVFQSPTVAEIVEVMSDLAGGREVLDEIARTLKEVTQLSPEQMLSMLAQLKESS
jgi:amino acid adenylation domain-containing protein